MFIADDPGLDFLNSIGTPAGTVIEWLANGEDLLAWLEQAKLIDSAIAAAIRANSFPGELDEVAAPVLDQALVEEGEEPLIVDLSGLDFICSAGIHALLRNRRPRSAIVCPPGNVARVLGIVRVEKATPLFDNVDAAHDAYELEVDR